MTPVVNYTYYSLPDSSGTILAGVGFALLGLTVVVVGVFQIMKPKPPPQLRQQQGSDEEKTHIVISSSDFEEVAHLLNMHQKEFSVQSF
jgi:predicted phage tail protein